MPRLFQSKMFLVLFVISFVFMGSYLYLLSQKNPECSPDEPSWIASGKIVHNLYMQGASPSVWEKGFETYKIKYWDHQTPPLGKLFIGLGASKVKVKNGPTHYAWNFKNGYYANRRMGRIPPKKVLQAGRLPIVFFGCLVLLFIYLICFEILKSKGISLLATLFFFSLPTFQIRAATAYVDIPQMAFFLIAIFLFLQFQKKGQIRTLIFSAIAIGLSCAIKYSSGLLVIMLALWLLFSGKNLKEKLLYPVLIGLLSSFTFFIINPYYYKSPVKKLTKLMKDWEQNTKMLQSIPKHKKQVVKSRFVALQTLTKRVVILPHSMKVGWLQAFKQTLFKSKELFFLVVLLGLACLGLLLRKYKLKKERAHLILFVSSLVVSQSISIAIAKTGSFSGFFICLGIMYGFYLAYTKEITKQLSFALFAFLIVFLGVTAWLPLDWPRYYLPVLVLVPIPFALGLYFFMKAWEPQEKASIPPIYSAVSSLFALTTCLWLSFGLLNFTIPVVSDFKKASLSELLVAIEAAETNKEKMKISLVLINRLFKDRKMILLNRELQETLKISGNNPSLWGKLALSYKFIGKPQKARSVILYAIRRFPRARSLVAIARSILPPPKKK